MLDAKISLATGQPILKEDSGYDPAKKALEVVRPGLKNVDISQRIDYPSVVAILNEDNDPELNGMDLALLQRSANRFQGEARTAYLNALRFLSPAFVATPSALSGEIQKF